MGSLVGGPGSPSGARQGARRALEGFGATRAWEFLLDEANDVSLCESIFGGLFFYVNIHI